ncbi:glycosyltransferase family 1 protein [Blautia sp. CLA-JM-H16]|uniref:Glycosyltransferase family 1 protein n=1 Tax=Blautia aquisgranensis TaxID=3133153 RepID=A0ABV1BCJ8_9FIRM
MHKILVFGMTENPGGVESFLYNYISEIDPGEFQFDFLCNSYEKIAYEDKLAERGCKMIHFIARSKNYKKYKQEIQTFFSKHGKEYECIWVNVCSLANIDYLKYAKKYGIPKRIIHSHNSKNMDSWLRGELHQLNRFVIQKYATDFWACSEAAVSWFYRDSLKDKAKVIHNAISTERMAYDPEKSLQLREKLGLQDAYIMGNVGRLHFQKNQEFLLKIFAQAVKKMPEARLVLVGQGEDEEKLKKLAAELGIEKYIYWAGVQKDICQWLSAFDLFVFPSRFEGAPIAALEAQANGLPILTSEQAVPEACVLNGNCRRLSLEEPMEKWVDELLKMAENAKREEQAVIQQNFVDGGYDIHTEVKKIEKLLCC